MPEMVCSALLHSKERIFPEIMEYSSSLSRGEQHKSSGHKKSPVSEDTGDWSG